MEWLYFCFVIILAFCTGMALLLFGLPNKGTFVYAPGILDRNFCIDLTEQEGQTTNNKDDDSMVNKVPESGELLSLAQMLAFIHGQLPLKIAIRSFKDSDLDQDGFLNQKG